MDAAIEHGRKVCPGENMTSAIEEIFNHTAFLNPVKDVPEYICDFRRVWALIFAHITVANCAHSTAIIIGIPSSIIALITLSSKEFSTVSFMYHKAINLIELVHTFSLLLSMLPTYFGGWVLRYLVIAVHQTYIKDRMEFAAQIALDSIIMWVSIERALLCHAPQLFEKVNRRGVAFAVILGCTFGAIILKTPDVFTQTFQYNNETGIYDISQTQYFYNYPPYQLYVELLAIINYAVCVLMIPAAVMTVMGLRQMSRRKKKLLSPGSFQSSSSKELLAHIALTQSTAVSAASLRGGGSWTAQFDRGLPFECFPHIHATG